MGKKGSYSLGSDGFLSGAENYPLSRAMVDHNQERIETRGRGKVSDKVTGDLLEGTGHTGYDKGKQENVECVRFVLLTHGTAFNVFPHVLYETWPPEFGSNKLSGLEVSQVAGGLMIVATGKDRLMEGVIRGNVDVALVGKDVVIIFPVRKMRPEGCGNVLKGWLEVLEYKRV